MKGRFIFFKGAYDTLDLFTDALSNAFINLGSECFIYDIREEEESLQKMAVFLMQPVDAAIGYNNMGFLMELVEGHILWDDLNILFINILMDHPFHYHEAMIRAPRQSVVLCPDRNHVKYVRRFYPNIARAEFLPHGGVEFQEGITYPKISEREIDVLYAGGLSRGIAESLIPDLEGFQAFDAVDLMKTVLEYLLKHPQKTTEDVIEGYFLKKGFEFSDNELRKYIADLRFIDSYATSWYREQAVRLLVENNIRVHVYGRGWECCDWISNDNFIPCGIAPADEIPKIMRNSKIVLNTMTWFKDGTHDRVFNAMLAGSVALTDSSIYMKEVFEDGKGLRIFELTEEWRIPEMVKELLNNEHKMQELADQGYKIAKEKCSFYLQSNFIWNEIVKNKNVREGHQEGYSEYTEGAK